MESIMKTAIYFGYIDNKSDANVKIAENIASQLSNLGHEVTLLGVSKDIFLEKSFTELSDSGAYKIVHMTENPVIRRHRARLGKIHRKEQLLIQKIISNKIYTETSSFCRSPYVQFFSFL